MTLDATYCAISTGGKPEKSYALRLATSSYLPNLAAISALKADFLVIDIPNRPSQQKLGDSISAPSGAAENSPAPQSGALAMGDVVGLGFSPDFAKRSAGKGSEQILPHAVGP